MTFSDDDYRIFWDIITNVAANGNSTELILYSKFVFTRKNSHKNPLLCCKNILKLIPFEHHVSYSCQGTTNVSNFSQFCQTQD